MGLGIYEPSVQIFHADCTIGRTGSTDAGRGFLYPAHPCGQSSFSRAKLNVIHLCGRHPINAGDRECFASAPDTGETCRFVRGDRSREEARLHMLQAGIRTVREEMTDENKEEAVQLIYAYSKRLQQSQITDKSDMREFWKATIAVRKIGLTAERNVAETWLRNIKHPQGRGAVPILAEQSRNLCLPADISSKGSRRIYGGT